MSAVTADAMPTLVTIPNVELVTVGEWDASTGTVEFTEEHLKAAIAALTDPAIKQPRARVGHTDTSVGMEESQGGFADQPVFGRFTNLRLNSTGTTIFADLAGVPAWLADILPSAYPSRSIEAWFDYSTKTGHKHAMVIASVSLLGEKFPAVETLEDLRLAFGDAPPDWVLADNGRRVVATRKDDAMPERVSASVATEDVRQSFYLDFAEADRYWWWIYKFYVSPAVVIADDDEGGYWAVPYTVAGDSITWGDPYEVEMQWVRKDDPKKVVAERAEADDGERVWRTAAESRPNDRVRAAKPTKEERMTAIAPAAVLERLGLPEDATEEQFLARLEEVEPGGGSDDDKPDDEPELDDDGNPIEKPTTETVTPPAAVVDAAALAQLQNDAKLGREAREQQVNAERDALVTDRIRKGCLTASSKAAHLAELAKGGAIEKAHRAYLESLTEGVIPVDEQGTAPSEIADEQATHASIMSAAYGIDVAAGKERS